MARQERSALPERRGGQGDMVQLDEAISELNARVQKLEEERDFYRALLEPPDRDIRSPSEGETPGGEA